MLAKVSEERDVRHWLEISLPAVSSDLFAANLPDTRSLLDRLERLADRGGRLAWPDDPNQLSRIAVAGVGEEIASRLRDAGRSSAARILLLRIGTELARPEVLAAAAEIVPDQSQDEVLRSWCASGLARSASADLLRSLVPFVEKAAPESREEKRIVSTLLAALVERGGWTAARAFRLIPEGPTGPIVDSTRMLARTLEEHMTLEDAAAIVASLDSGEVEGLNNAAADLHARPGLRADPRWETLAAAVKKLALAQPVDPARLRRLHPFVLTLGGHTAHHEHELITALAHAYQASEIGRRELFEAVVKAEKVAGNGSKVRDLHRWWWMYHLLKPDDLSWLVDRLVELAEGAKGVWQVWQVWQIALYLLEHVSEESLKRAVRETVATYAPDALTGYEKARAEQQERERKARGREQKEQLAQRLIGDLDREILSDLNRTPQQRLWRLSQVNFSNEARPRNVVGAWSDVPPELQREVLAACAQALGSIEPTPVHDGSSFPGSLLFEAQAFSALWRQYGEEFPLTPDRIQRWLPAVLKALRHDEGTLLEDCLRVAPETTENVVLEAVARELRGETAYSILLQDLPASLWTEKVTRWVANGIHGEQLAKARPSLLGFLAARRPEAGIEVARDVLSRQQLGQILAILDGQAIGEPDELGIQAIGVLLALAPGEVWPQVEKAAALAGSRFFELMSGFTHWAREGLAVRWEDWPLERIARLAKLLFAAYPPEGDPPDDDLGDRFLGPVDDLRELRWRTLGHLADSKAPDAAATVEAVKEIHPEAKAWLDRFQASREANDLFAGGHVPARFITVAKACRVLDDEHYRLIRSADDLLEVVVEELEKIETDVGNDLALLYCPSADRGGERRRREDALQAYVLRRLQDRLPGKVLDHETRVKRRKRTDVRVLAQVIGRQQGPARVVIEVKWSDNGGQQRGISTGLPRQLGQDYLLAENLGHGIYLVGWTGKLGTWNPSAGPKPANSREALAEALRRQADQFRRDHPEIDIRPIVWDLRLSTSEPTTVSPKRRRGSNQP
jgi:hypothetical protein